MRIAVVVMVMMASVAMAQDDTPTLSRRAGENITEFRLRALETCVAKMESQQSDIKERLIGLESDIRYTRQGVADIKHSIEVLAENSKSINTNDLIAYALLGLLGLGGGGVITARRMKTKQEEEK